MSDRRVHGQTADGGKIVRYNRAGKWYVEYPPASYRRSRHITVGRAAELACEDGAGAFLGLPGGARFDRLVRMAGGS